MSPLLGFSGGQNWGCGNFEKQSYLFIQINTVPRRSVKVNNGYNLDLNGSQLYILNYN